MNRPNASHDGAQDGRGSLLQTVKPFIAAAAVLVTGSLLVATVSFTELGPAWIAFLAGVLFASILAMSTQAARAELSSSTRTEQLALARFQLSGETAHREALQKQLAAATVRLHFSDESLPVMLAFVDHTTRYQYHNRAFRNWLGLAAEKIDGQHMREVLGRKVFAEVEAYVAKVADGTVVRYERTHKTPGGTVYRLAVQYLPQFANDGRYTGFYVAITDVTERRDVLSLPPRPAPVKAADVTHDTPHDTPHGIPHGIPLMSGGRGPKNCGDTTLTWESAAKLEEEWQSVSRRILAAINGDEFTLFCQAIRPLASGTSAKANYEVLIRLLEEESSLIPPGAFFALAEEHGLLPHLDRWVVTHVLEWMVTPAGAATVRAGAVYFINIATATIGDPDFPEFVELELRRTGVPGRAVCFEIAEDDLIRHQGDAVAFAHSIKESGCLIAISGFGRDRVKLQTLKLFPLDFLKIDGSIVRQVVAYPAYLGRAVAISRMAKAIGVRTIAEMVEDDATLSILRELNVDYGQGFGISLPMMLADLTTTGDTVSTDTTLPPTVGAELHRASVAQQA